MTRYELLGPLRAVRDGDEIELPVGKPRAVLARLLLDANRVVSVEELVDALWGEQPPASATKLVQAYVSQLRKALGEHAIETRPPGYAVRLAGGELDLARFERLAAEADETADPRHRAELLREALALWRGPALAEFRAEPFAVGPSRRLAELRLAGLEEQLEAELELGRHERAVPELEALVAEEPLRERPRRLLMLALYRSGRHAEALERYRDARRLLVDELGIEPSAGLQELERAILRRDASLDVSSRTRDRGCVVCVGAALASLAAPLCADGRELVLVEVVDDGAELAERARRLESARRALEVEARAAAFTTATPGDDLARLATEQDAELLLTPALDPASLAALVAASPCDVAVAMRPELPFEPAAPVVVPFGGGRDEWAALELGAWLARAHALPLRVVGAEGGDGRRDASRLLAAASLALQRFAGVAAEPALVPPGVDGVLAEEAALVVASLPAGELGRTRSELAERAGVPLLLVHGGVRPGGLAPARTLTRFSWSLAG